MSKAALSTVDFTPAKPLAAVVTSSFTQTFNFSVPVALFRVHGKKSPSTRLQVCRLGGGRVKGKSGVIHEDMGLALVCQRHRPVAGECLGLRCGGLMHLAVHFLRVSPQVLQQREHTG